MRRGLRSETQGGAVGAQARGKRAARAEGQCKEKAMSTVKGGDSNEGATKNLRKSRETRG